MISVPREAGLSAISELASVEKKRQKIRVGSILNFVAPAMADSSRCHCRRRDWSLSAIGRYVNSRKRMLEQDGHRRSRYRLRVHGESPWTEKNRRMRGTADDYRGRRWAYSPCDLSSYKERFMIVSYNILGDENVSKHSDLYDNVTAEHLSWEKRKHLICKELRLYSPCILCFQEVDQFDDLADLLCKDGYIGVYKGRTGFAHDGCAIFWKEDRFSLLYEESIEYQNFGLRDNVAQFCLLQASADHSSSGNASSLMSGQKLLIGNIHVLFNPNRGDIKLGQIRLMLERANTISQEWGNHSVVICGDFNSIPQSAIYRFISSPMLDMLMYERKKVSGQIQFQSGFGQHTSYDDGSRFSHPLHKYHQQQPPQLSHSHMGRLLRNSWSEEEICIAGGSSGCTLLQNPLKLSSAYTGVPGTLDTRDSNGEPLATSYHSKFMGTVDYIWHSSNLVPVRVLETLPITALRELGSLPSENWGSDHLSLVCELAFASNTSKNTCNFP